MARLARDLLQELESLRPAPIGPMSVDTYLALSRDAADRYEYVGGLAYAMGGGTILHHDVCHNVAAVLRARCAGTPCRSYMQIARVQTPHQDMYLPDAMVSCGPRPAPDAQFIEDPCVVIEVLSPSTARTDFGEKRIAYQEIPTLRAYLVIETTWRAVHRMWREADGTWQRETIADASGGVVPLPCPDGATLTLDEIYEDVELPSDPPRATRVFEQLAEA